MGDQFQQTAHQNLVAVAAMSAAVLARTWDGNVVFFQTGNQDSSVLVQVRSDDGNHLQVSAPFRGDGQDSDDRLQIQIEAMIDGASVDVRANSIEELRQKFYHLVHHQNFIAGTHVDGSGWCPPRNAIAVWAESFFEDGDDY